ncbi:MAG: multifunctional CCA tRNA nucleotidyl transferase/2'3'-cyclic phosphodiesterase/2'nucleotidase/phosphatase [Betaproteobacteria bacterium]|nr:multifunctional CCA tRNA nucleotidyl transferase/2'3'-cyclic phosphodiesterase/2'nucleotidase/phosphatase [Betaproteobacteria bacterium]MBI2960567.1 multifunctional CCA tRNA nucleotidyl transferase/2'3'-cyclic phosphodiesterase/2'nucleotidase/phosphatase [Betaproteobacteria bacterium]
MKIYSVGGCVRDELLGLPVADRDYVVVGATPEEMVRRGFRPVGKDFPVFLHPQTQEQYALARTERKVARGYRGFTVFAAPEVTLEQDLARRDLTINAIARDAEGRLIDPYGGEADLRAGVLRHVSPAFAEDPVRILRVGRFAARFSFPVAADTMALMQRMVREGEADALVPERVWLEFSRALMERSPARLFAVLAEVGLLEKLVPELGLEFSAGNPANDAARVLIAALGHAAKQDHALPERFALLTRSLRFAKDASGRLRSLSERLRAPNDCSGLARVALRHAEAGKRGERLGAPALLALLEGCDALRRPARLDALLRTCEAEFFGECGWVEVPYRPRLALARALAAATRVDAGAIARGVARSNIAAAVRAARLAAIAAACARRRG